VIKDDEHRFAVVVGDVSGHDITAAGVMAALRYTIRTLAKIGIPPDEILDRTTNEMDVATDDHFATALVGVVDTRMQEMTLASAGHPPPLLVREGCAIHAGRFHRRARRAAGTES
jgi:serine phosphatase RsbU (regulator of sigma subunit)